MTAIAGIACGGKTREVGAMLDQLNHRGSTPPFVVNTGKFTLGGIGTHIHPNPVLIAGDRVELIDGWEPSRFARAVISPDGILLERDPLGAAPLYYGWTSAGELCFASEVKALLGVAESIFELPPGSRFDGAALEVTSRLELQPPASLPPEEMARELRLRLEDAVQNGLGSEGIGSWLSGGLDSSAVAALARLHTGRLYTFAAGQAGAPDLTAARIVADYIGSDHHEVIIDEQDMLSVLDEVIYHLESFDALLVRSTLTNYLVARACADYIPAVFSGEGGDELFAGYEYLKSLDPARLPEELIDITARLHNTALQRVDRSASAHGLEVHTVFLDQKVVDYALIIPVEYKLHDGVEKWILRRALDGLLPEEILNRPKAKFWEGSGVKDTLADYADTHISGSDFQRERVLPNGWQLNSKEELMYYRVFREHFGVLDDLSWMGRTKGAPVSA